MENTIDKKLKQSFDLWVITFEIKDGVGKRPDWDSLENQLEWLLKEKYHGKKI